MTTAATFFQGWGDPMVPLTAKELVRMHATQENAMLQARKVASVRTKSIINQYGTEASLPPEIKRLIEELKVVKFKKTQKKMRRNQELKNAAWWETAHQVITTVGSGLTAVAGGVTLFTNFFHSGNVSLVGRLMLPAVTAAGVMAHGMMSRYSTEKSVFMTKGE